MVLSIAGRHDLDQQFVRRRHPRDFLLQVDDRHERFHLGVIGLILGDFTEFFSHAESQRFRERKFSAEPARHGAAGFAFPHVDGHIADHHEFERLSREEKRVALVQLRDEIFLNRSELPAFQVFHFQRGRP